jgi:O-antigen/teichoic acid export membrane protein
MTGFLTFLGQYDKAIAQLLAVLVAVAGAIAWFPRSSRARLKDDLAILDQYTKLLTSSDVATDPHLRTLTAYIRRSIDRSYGTAVDWSTIRRGLFMVALGVVNLYVENPPSVVATIVAALCVTVGGFILIDGVSRSTGSRPT